MRAAWYDRTGPADEVFRLGERPTPAPGPGEVLVAIRASGINPSDTKARAGWRSSAQPTTRTVPHSDGAGVVEAAGADVDPSWVGRRVWLWNAQGAATYSSRNGPSVGTAAEYAVVPLRHAAPLPDGISFETGACLGVPACTAHYAVFADGDVRGQTVLVQGGAGAVGELAVQFAAHAGATVIATVGSHEKAQLAKAAGASLVIDRHKEDVVAAVLAFARDGVHRIIEVDFGANAEADAKMIAVNGTISSYSSTSRPEPVLPYYPLQFRGTTLRFVQGYLLPDAARNRAIEDIGTMLAGGSLRPTIAASFPLDEIARAHELVESGRAMGNVVLMI
jgi:NADPH:quinone reductase-like Zn-dependent oxidoreductase